MLDKQDLDLFILRCINNGWTTRTLKPKPVSLKTWRLEQKWDIRAGLARFCSPENIYAQYLIGEEIRDAKAGRIAV